MSAATILQSHGSLESPAKPLELKPVKYELTPAQLADMRTRLTGLPCTNNKERDAVGKAVQECVSARGGIEKLRKELKDDSLKYGREVDRQAEHFKTLILEIETPLKKIRDVWDDAKENEKRAKAEAERQRIAAEERAKRDAEEAELKAKRDAEEAKLRAEREALEAERKKLEAEKAAERQRAEAEQAKAREQQRLIDEANAAEKKKLDDDRRAFEAERQRLERIEIERLAMIKAEKDAAEAAERKRQWEAEEAERARLAEERRRAAAKAEAARLEALKPDAEKLADWAARLKAMPLPAVESAEAADAVIDAAEAMDVVIEKLINWQPVSMLEPVA